MPKTRQRFPGRIQDKEQQQSHDMRRNNLVLFIQQVEKEAQDRINESEFKLETMFREVDKVFNVELMKMPPALQNTLLCDLTREEEVPASEVSIAVKSETHLTVQPFRRIPSKRIRSTDSPPVGVQRSSSKTQKGGKRAKKTRTLAGSNSSGNLAPSSTSLRRVQSCLNRNPTEQMAANQTHRKLRSVMSASDLPCSMTGSAAHVTVTTARGETVSFSEETKDDINLDLLDDVAWCQIQKLSRLMDHLAQKSHCQH